MDSVMADRQIVLSVEQVPQLSGDWTVGEILLALEQAREWVLRLQVSRAAPDTAAEVESDG